MPLAMAAGQARGRDGLSRKYTPTGAATPKIAGAIKNKPGSLILASAPKPDAHADSVHRSGAVQDRDFATASRVGGRRDGRGLRELLLRELLLHDRLLRKRCGLRGLRKQPAGQRRQ